MSPRKASVHYGLQGTPIVKYLREWSNAKHWGKRKLEIGLLICRFICMHELVPTSRN